MTTTPTAPPVPAATPPPAPPQKSSGCLKWFLVGCGVLIALFAAFCAVLVFVVFGAIKRSEVYKGALHRAQSDPRVIAALGEPIEAGFLVTGNVKVDTDGGNASINFPISGPKGKAKVHAVATLEGGQWKYETLTVTPENGAMIDLNSPP
ncbi:MAG TPA: cytochrome c oxidase assembly factor Coa1 family protein [Thermoanaerobaculia bacterium]|jgi:hypothetical protein